MGPANSLRISRVLRYSGADGVILKCRIRGCHPLWPIFPDRSTISYSTLGVGPITPTVPKHGWFGLLRVRSPLLAESLLFSFPAGNEMFQFPAFASLSGCQAFCLTGCPIRRSGGLWLFAPYPGFSQLITSFFAPESLGIRHVPLFTILLPIRCRMSSYTYCSLFQSCQCACGIFFLVENNGFEPLTLCVQSRCSSQLS